MPKLQKPHRVLFTTYIDWFDPSEVLPEYQAHMGSNQFVCVLVVDQAGGVWAGDYTNGKFYLAGAAGPEESALQNVAAWAYWPDEIEFKRS